MQLEDNFTFAGPRALVFELLLNPEVLARALPGTRTLEQIDDATYRGEAQIRVGPMSGNFTMHVRIVDKQPPVSFRMEIEGKGALGFVQGNAAIELAEAGPAATVMHYHADMQIGGKLAVVGQRLLDSVGKSMAKQSLENLSRELQARLRVSGQ
ncbi:MAG: CoxG family protein [bacterium]